MLDRSLMPETALKQILANYFDGLTALSWPRKQQRPSLKRKDQEGTVAENPLATCFELPDVALSFSWRCDFIQRI